MKSAFSLKLALVFYFLVCTWLLSVSETSVVRADSFASCTVCHGSDKSFFKGKALVLKKWVSDSPNGIPETHKWFSPQLAKEVAHSSLANEGELMKIEDSFYHQLTALKEAAKKSEPDEAARKKWVALIDRADKEVPAFDGVFWNPAKAILSEKTHIRGHLVHIARAITAPFRTVLLFPGQKAFYNQTLNTGVKGVAFIRGSSKQYDNEMIYTVKGTKSGKVAISLSMKDVNTDYTVTADFLLDSMGKVSEFSSNPPNHDRALQFARRWAKAKRDRLDKFQAEQELKIPDMAGREIEPVTLVADVETKGIVTEAVIEGETVKLQTPCLHAEGTFRQKEGEHMGIRGEISIYMMANGLTAYSDGRMRFKKRVGGFMVKGNTRNRMRIDLSKSIAHPSIK